MGKLVETKIMSHLPSNTIFRQNAIDSLNAIDDVAETLQIISPGAWIWLLGSILSLAALITWGLFGALSLTIETQGIVFDKSQVAKIETNNNKNLLDHHDNVNDLYDLYNKKLELYKNHYITRIDLRKSKEEYLAAKDISDDIDKSIRIPMIESQEQKMDHEPIVVLTFVGHKQGKKIVPGMSAQILPATSSVFDHGYIAGTVSGISAYPISKLILIYKIIAWLIPTFLKVRLF